MDLNKQMEKPGRNWSRRDTFTKIFVILTQTISPGDSLNWEHFGYIVNDFVHLKVRFVCSIQRTWWSVTDFEILEDHIMFKLKGAFQSHRPRLPEKCHSNLEIWRDGGSTKLCPLQAVQFPASSQNWAPSLHPSYLTVLVRTLYMVLSCPHGCLIINTLLDFFFWYCFYGKFSDIKVENTI